MMFLENKQLEAAIEFSKWNIGVYKSRIDFSSLAIDQVREQNNAVIKGDGE